MSSHTPSPTHAASHPLAFVAFRWFLVSQTLVTIAVQMQMAAVSYQLYRIGGDVLSLGLLGLAEAVPAIAVALFGGHIADRHDRRRICLWTLGVMTLAAVALMALSHQQHALAAMWHRRAIYGLVMLIGLCRGLLQPARVALSAELIPRALYPRAIAWRTSAFQLSSIVGPALGGIAYAAVGGTGAYGIAAAFLFAGVVAMAFIRPPAPVAVPAVGPRASVLASVREGFVFLRNEPVLLPALALDLFAVLFGGATALLPVFAEDILEVGPRGFGALRAAPAAGALFAALCIGRFPITRAGRSILLAAAGFGLCIIGFGLSRVYVLSLLLLAASGGLDMISVVVRSTLLALRVPNQMLGRVSSINQIFIGSSNEIGAFESGLTARLMGTVPAVVFGGCMTLLVVATTAAKAPALRKLGPLVGDGP